MKDRGIFLPQENSANSSVLSSLWLRREQALRLFGIGWRRLEQWRLNGFVRSVKLGQGKTSTRLYFSSDLNDVLMALAAGRKPVVKLGRVSK